MKLNDKIVAMHEEGKSEEEIADYILELKKEEDRKRTIQRIRKI
jgi:hypothetical protein